MQISNSDMNFMKVADQLSTAHSNLSAPVGSGDVISEKIDLKTLFATISEVAETDRSSDTTLGHRLNRYENMSDSLRTFEHKLKQSSSHKNVFGKIKNKLSERLTTKGKIQRSERKEVKKALSQATQDVNQTIASLRKSLKAQANERVKNNADSKILEFRDKRINDRETLQKLVVHYCFDRQMGKDDLEISPDVRSQLKKLEGMEYPLILDWMGEQLVEELERHIDGESGQLTATGERLMECANDLEFAAQLDVRLTNNFETLEADYAQAQPTIDKVQQKITEAKSELDTLRGLDSIDSKMNYEAVMGLSRKTKGDIAHKMCDISGLNQEVSDLNKAWENEADPTKAADLRQQKNEVQAKIGEFISKFSRAESAGDLTESLKLIEASGETLQTAVTDYTTKFSTKLDGLNDELREAEGFQAHQIARFDAAEERLIECSSSFIERIDSHSSRPNGVMLAIGMSDHAMMMQVTQQKNGKYQVVIHNTGDGVEFHPEHDTDRTKRQTGLTWSNVSADKIKDPSFIRSIMKVRQRTIGEHQKREFDINGKPEKLSVVFEIYQRAMEQFGEGDPASQREEDYHKIQIRGTCTQQVTNAWLESCLPKSTYLGMKARVTSSLANRLNESGNDGEKAGDSDLDLVMKARAQQMADYRSLKA